MASSHAPGDRANSLKILAAAGELAGAGFLADELLRILDQLAGELAAGGTPSTATLERWREDVSAVIRIAEALSDFCDSGEWDA